MVRRRDDGAFELVLDDARRDVLVQLLRELGELIDADPDHPNLKRLSPPAYLDDDDAQAAFQLLAGEELRTSRQAAIASVIDGLGRDRLTEDDLWTWLQAINGIRLVVGTRLDISDDDHGPNLRTLADPEARRLWAVYDFATGLQHDVVDALDQASG
jgi:hypothetical protein